MKRFNCSRITLVLMVFGLVLVLTPASANADFAFGEPVNLKSVIPVIDPAHESIDCFSSDGLEMYIESDRPGGHGEMDLWVLRRASIEENWGPPENLGPGINSPRVENGSSISNDGLTLYFNSFRSGGYGSGDIYMTTRTTANAPWGPAVNLGPKINGSSFDGCPCISPDGLELYFLSGRPGGYGDGDIYVTRRATLNDPWGEPVNIGPEINSPYNELPISLSPDGLLLLFDDSFSDRGPRPGGYGDADMWMTRRASLSDPWQSPVNLGPKINSSARDAGPVISPDGRMLYFFTFSNETWDNWQVPIEPVVDFNDDGIVDATDMCIMIDHWGENYPLCDIGPFAWGDGIVDVQDLIVLAGHLFEETRPAESVQSVANH